MPWTKKYSPVNTAEVIGQKKAVDDFILWHRNWKPGKAALFHGPPGTGKTCLIEAIGKEKNLEIIELNASNYRTPLQIKEVLGKSMSQSSLFKKGKIFLIDEIDGLSGRADRGGVGEIIKIIKQSHFPIVLTANDPWKTKFSSLRQNCKLIQFPKVNYWSAVKRLKFICQQEKIQYQDSVINLIAKKSQGDIRSAINDLQLISKGKTEIKLTDIENVGKREIDTNIFDTMKIIFKTKTALSAKLSMQNLDKKPDEVFWWIEQNIINEYEKPEEISKAYEYLSMADIFRKRIIRRQNWKLLKYMIDLMTAGVALSKKEMYKKFSRYQYPDKIKYLGRTKFIRYQEKQKLLELSKELHCSTKKIKQEYLPFLKIMGD